MAISGIEPIVVGAENQASGSDTIYDAFNKTANNFTKLFSCASPYTNFVAGNGISTTVTASNGTIKIDSTGVQSVQAGTGVTVLETGGVVTISASGNGQVGVTNVGISSSTLNVFNSPIISAGVMQVDLPALSIEPGQYIAPTVSVDQYGRITEISNTVSTGTVTSIAVDTAGPGLAITGSPITDSGTITITNTGVTRLNAGTGIELSGSNGNITVSSSVQSQGVTRVDVSSNTLTVTNSPITRSGTISVELPTNITLAGNLTANHITCNTITYDTLANVNAGNLIATGLLSVAGNANIANIGTTGLIVATGNITGGNLLTAGIISATGNVTGGNLVTAGRANVTGNLSAGNITTAGTLNGNLVTASNVAAANITSSGNVTAVNFVGNGSTLSGIYGPALVATQTVYQGIPVSASTIANLTIVYNSVSASTGSEYNSTTGVFTASKAGIYHITASIGVNVSGNLTADGAGAIVVYKNTSPIASGPYIEARSLTVGLVTTTVIDASTATASINLAVGDTLRCKLLYITNAPTNSWTTETNLVPSSLSIAWMRP
jgi:hypothetical protein